MLPPSPVCNWARWLVAGNPLSSFYYSILWKLRLIPRVMTSGIVKTKEIGQSAELLPKSVMIGYGRLSTTERPSVNNEGLINLSWLKIQSTPYEFKIHTKYCESRGSEKSTFHKAGQ